MNSHVYGILFYKNWTGTLMLTTISIHVMCTNTPTVYIMRLSVCACVCKLLQKITSGEPIFALYMYTVQLPRPPCPAGAGCNNYIYIRAPVAIPHAAVTLPHSTRLERGRLQTGHIALIHNYNIRYYNYAHTKYQ